jgi:hypothetical protein
MRFSRSGLREPTSEDLHIEMTIRWGLTTVVVATSHDAPRLWLHTVHLNARAERRDHGTPVEDAHDVPIPVPLRMHPGGSLDAQWRPTSFDLEDPGLHRPRFTATAAVSLPRRPASLVHPPVSVIDDFVFDGDQYVLRPDSELYRPRPER